MGVLARAVERCPLTTELYYLAARTILNRVCMCMLCLGITCTCNYIVNLLFTYNKVVVVHSSNHFSFPPSPLLSLIPFLLTSPLSFLSSLSPSFFFTQASVPAAERLTQAVRWLEKCVQQFYQISAETKPDHNETLLLYRLAWAGACTETIMSQA